MNITLGSAIPDYTVIYMQDNVTLGQDLATCDRSIYLYETILDQGLLPVNTIAGDRIYPTDIPGIGMSVFSTDIATSLPVFPSLAMSGWVSAQTGEYIMGKIKFRKIPGDIPMQSGVLSVNGPVVGQVLNNPHILLLAPMAAPTGSMQMDNITLRVPENYMPR